MSDEELIHAHKDSWSTRELMGKILSRHCHVLEDIGGRVPTYLVTEKQDENMHDALVEINKHLSKLGYSARLYPDDPWIIQLIPDPTRQWPSPRFVASMWILSMLTTLLAGEMWMDGARPKDGWFVSNVTLDAFLGYTLPLFSALIVASFVQKKIAAQKGVHLPHLFPIPGPAMIWWPFGILGFASLPRSDARLWPDRSSLGVTALSAPLVMILTGMSFILIGLNLTPDIVPLLSTPLAVELPLIIQLIGLSMEGETALLLKTSWAHPLTRVGMTLTFLGWVSLLPIPTFPGGRILIARMGIPEARSGSTQVMLLLVVLLFAFLFGAFAGWNIWVPIVALTASLLITKGSDPRLPIVLDDFKGLPEIDHRRLGVILFMSFMLALPSQIPFYEDNYWDDEITWEIGDDKLSIEEGWFNQTITVSNPSLIVQEWEITYLGGLYGSSDLTELDCKSGEMKSENTCSGTIDPLDKINVQFSLQWMESWNTSEMEVSWLVGKEIISSSVRPDLSVYPIGMWEFNGDLDDPETCISIKSKSDTLNVSADTRVATWDNLNQEGNITLSDENQICLQSLSGDDMAWVTEMEFSIDNATFKSGYHRQNEIAISDEGVLLNENELLFSQSVLALNHEGNCIEFGNPSPPLFSDNGTRVWNMSILPVALNRLEQSNDSIVLYAEEGSNITDCESIYNPKIYTVSKGPTLIVGTSEERTQHWIGTVEFDENLLLIENPMSYDVPLLIEFDGDGPQWDVSTDIVLESGQSTSVSATAPLTGHSYSWLELDDGDVILHLVNHEE
ncbi:MAG: hypothetical protein ACPGNS_03710 [Candidatus Poseidoniaceae archaeon]